MPQTKEQKRIEAQERQAEYDKLSTLEKLERQFQNGGTLENRQSVKLLKRLAKETGLTDYTCHRIAPYVRAKKG